MGQSVDQLIMNELAKIERASIPSPYHSWTCDIHVNNRSYRMPTVNQVSVDRDYLGNAFDVFKLVVKCDPAIYNTIIYPNRAKLKVTLIRRPNYFKGSGDQFDPLYQVEQYIGRLVGNASGTMVGENPFATSTTATNQHSLMDIQLQITSPVIARLRSMYYGTNHLNTSAIDCIKTLLTRFSVDSGDRSGEVIRGVDVADNYSETKRDQIIIPHTIPYIDVPAHIDRYSDSIYPTGFGYYLQNGMWYIFSPFDVKRYERGRYTTSLTIINVPSFQLPGIEKTYRNTGTQIILVANGETRQQDHTERAAMNEGTGSRFVDAKRSLDSEDVYNDGKMEFEPSNYINEFNAVDREVGMTRLSTTRAVTGNMRYEYGKLAKNNGSLVGVIWDLSAPDLLYPGMPVKYVYMENGLPQNAYGVLIGVESKDSTANDNVSDPIFSTTSYLKLFLERK